MRRKLRAWRQRTENVRVEGMAEGGRGCRGAMSPTKMTSEPPRPAKPPPCLLLGPFHWSGGYQREIVFSKGNTQL